jgi:hypothetical protein
MKLQIIETDNYVLGDYILAVSDEEIKEGDLCVYNKNHNSRNPNWELIRCGVIEREEMHPHSNNKLLLWMKKIIAHQPKGIAPKLDLPLLPEMVVEDDIENLAEINSEKHHYAFGQQSEFYQLGFIEGYKAATKVYSEEDLKKAFIQGKHGGVTQSYMDFEEFIQSLKQPKTPKWFVAEMDCGESRQCMCNSNDDCLKPVLKTTTINNKTYLVGTYLNQ